MAGTYDGSTMKVFVDGRLEDSQSYSGGMLQNTNQLLIGWDPGGVVENRHFNGKIDDVRIYNRALSDSEIQQLAAPCLQIWTAVEIGVATQTGRLYQLQWTPQLSPTQWANFGTQFVGTGYTDYFFDSTRTSGLRFYRFVTTNQ